MKWDEPAIQELEKAREAGLIDAWFLELRSDRTLRVQVSFGPHRSTRLVCLAQVGRARFDAVTYEVRRALKNLEDYIMTQWEGRT